MRVMTSNPTIDLVPLIVPLPLPADFLRYVLSIHRAPTTIIICCTRSAFLSSTADCPKFSALTSPNLHQLSLTKTVRVAFCPTASHLRAYLAVYTAVETDSTLKEDRISPDVPIMGLLNPITLHRHTPAMSAQGIAQTIAVAVEAARRNGMKLIICECPEEDDGVRRVWEEQVPLLDGSIRLDGLGPGRTISVGKVFARWCVIQEPAEGEASVDEEMEDLWD